MTTSHQPHRRKWLTTLAIAPVLLTIGGIGWASASEHTPALTVSDTSASVLPGTLTNNSAVPTWVNYAGPGGDNLQPGDSTDRAGAWLVGPHTVCTWHLLDNTSQGANAARRVTANPGLGEIWVTASGYNEVIDSCAAA